MGRIKDLIDEKAGEILASRGIERGVGSVEEWEEAKRFLLLEEGRLDLIPDNYEHDILEDFRRQGVYPYPEYF